MMFSMRILVTGHRGNVGSPVAARLRELGHEIVGFDLADGQDLLDPAAVLEAAAGCAAVVHLAAIAHDDAGRPEQIMARYNRTTLEDVFLDVARGRGQDKQS